MGWRCASPTYAGLSLGAVVGLGLRIGGIVALEVRLVPSGPVFQVTENEPHLADFDFLLGDWRVHHRRLGRDGNWLEAEGTASHKSLAGRWANMDEYVIEMPAGTYRAAAFRAFDPRSGRWSIWWLDGRYPEGPVDPPVVGSFERGVGTFYSDDVADGRPRRTRFIWSRITPVSARWEQAFSSDSGRTWVTNWIMEFRRVQP